MLTAQSSPPSQTHSSNCLPGGYIDRTGAVHKHFALRGLIGRDEEFLADNKMSSAHQSREVLARCLISLGSVESIDHSLIDDLLVGDRDYLMLMLRKLSFGNRVEAVINCPAPDCNTGIDIDFNISDIPITPTEVKPSYQISIDPTAIENTQEALKNTAAGLELIDALLELPEIVFRLPKVADQIALAEAKKLSQIDTRSFLLSRCILKLGTIQDPSLEHLKNLPSRLRHTLEQAMESLAPNLSLTMDMQCPCCARDFDVPFELQDFFWGEVNLNGDILRREVHYLAFHYHWSEQEIMSMPREKRQAYVANLNEEIQRLNDALE